MDLGLVEIDKVSSEETKKKRMEFFKNALKYYQSRSLSLDVILASKQQSLSISDNINIHDTLNKNTTGLYDDIVLLDSLKNCVKMIQNSLTCYHYMSLDNFPFKWEIMNTIEGIIHLSKSLMKLSEEKISELDFIEKKKKYTSALGDYGKYIDMLKNKGKELNDDDAKTLEKAELQVYKINLMRVMKAVLLSYASVNYPDIFQRLQNLKDPIRRNLTVEDFTNTWDVELIS